MSNAVLKIINDDNFKQAILPRLNGDSVYADKFIKMFSTAVRKDQKLMECSIESLKNCAAELAELDLSPSPALGQAYLISYKGECSFRPGWRGLMHIAIRDSGVKYMHADIVYECDMPTFKLSRGFDPTLVHDINLAGDRSKEKIVGAYAVCILQNGMKMIEVMNKQELEILKNTYSNSSSQAWSKSYSEMARKSVIRKLCKYINGAPALARAIEIDNEIYEKDITPVVEDSSQDSKADLKGRLADKAKKTKPVVIDDKTEKVIESETVKELNTEASLTPWDELLPEFTAMKYKFQEGYHLGVVSAKYYNNYLAHFKVDSGNLIPNDKMDLIIDDIEKRIRKAANVESQ